MPNFFLRLLRHRHGSGLLLTFWLTAVSVAWAAAPANLDPASQRTATESSAAKDSTDQRDLNALREDVVQQLGQAEQRLRQAIDSGETGWRPVALQQQVGQLKYLALLYAQQQEMQKELNELKNELDHLSDDEAALAITDPSQPRPFSFLYLEELRDQLDAEITKADAVEAELANARQSIESCQDRQGQNERERRRIKEELNNLEDPRDSEKLRSELMRAGLKCRNSEETIRLRRLEVSVKERDLVLCRKRQLALQHTVERVQRRVTLLAVGPESEAFAIGRDGSGPSEGTGPIPADTAASRAITKFFEDRPTAVDGGASRQNGGHSGCSRIAAQEDHTDPTDDGRPRDCALLLEPAIPSLP